jgi:hypothetical protein
MLRRLLLVGFLLAVPGAAHAGMQLQLLQQQQVWHLQQQERRTQARQDNQLRQQLLQQPANSPPLPDPQLRDLGLSAVHPDEQKALQQRLIHHQQLLGTL